MIGYFDTSSIVPMLIREDNADQCHELWNGFATILTSRVTFIEVHAALAAAERAARISASQSKGARRILDELWRGVFVIELSALITEGAGACAREYGLRSLDAIHCASAMTVGGIDVLAVSGDKALLGAWLQGGLAVVDTSSV